MLERVTAGEALYRVVRTLTDRRLLDDILAEILAQTRAMLDAAETYILLKVDEAMDGASAVVVTRVKSIKGVNVAASCVATDTLGLAQRKSLIEIKATRERKPPIVFN